MSWFSNPFARSLEPLGDNSDGDEEDEHAHGQGVKEDLSQLTQTLKKQLWGVASFLAPPPQTKDLDNADVNENYGGVQSEALTVTRNADHLASTSLSEDLVDVDFDAFLDETLDDKPAEASKGEMISHSSLPDAQHGLTGISRDLAELKGSVTTGFSKILRAVREEIDLVESSKSYTGNISEDEADDSTGKSPRSTVAEKSQGFNMYLKPLINNILQSGKGEDLENRTDASSDEGDDEGDSKDHDNLHPSNLQDTFMHGFRGISKLASSLISANSDFENVDYEKRRSLQVVGLTEEVLAFAKNISMHPETWLDFPSLPDDEIDDFEMSAAQKKHLDALEIACPSLSVLKTELCPDCITENRFWKIYFILLHSRLSETDALLLSTPKIMQARGHLSQKLQNDDEHDAFMKKAPNSSESDKIFSSQSTTDLPIIDCREKQAGSLLTDLAEEVQNKDVLVSTVKLATSSVKGEKLEVNRWLNEEPLPHIPFSAPETRDEDDVSFSDLEEDDGKTTKNMGRSNSSQSFEWVQLNKTSSAENFDGLKLKGLTHGDGAAQHYLPQSSSQANRKQGQSESSDWSTVEEDDAASSDSLPS
ncbi:hypothetical protein GOP47_0022283 [Adiantum capillus-veneris]|uniref:BSD domain-containing protein n=1 Tax=Adiantum capillus-veneris TaxID=13818 RepID=A0A9D4UB13_ADICA|nr:hypothetical protein GOP47_0022283 [Adiantum capillus-veneris]